MKRGTIFTLAAILLITPIIAAAAGLVPCGGTADGEPACQMCYVVTLMENVLNWLVVVLTAVVAIVFVVSGLRLVTSAGNPSVMQSAKSMITNTFIGFVIVLAAWILIDFGMKALLSGGGGETSIGPWNSIECTAQPQSTIVAASRGLANGGTISDGCDIVSYDEFGDPVFDCSAQIAACSAGGGEPEVITTDPTAHTVECAYSATAYSGSCSEITDPSNPCHASQPNMIAAFGSRVEEASIICNKESGGAPVRSGSDLCCGTDGSCSGDPSFSGGYFQINILAHADKIPGCTPGAFYDRNGTAGPQGDCMRRNGEGVCTGWTCSITNTAMYNECMKVTTNSALNFQIAGQLFAARGNRFNDWSWSARRCNIPY